MKGMLFHIFVILCLDYLYMREYILQLACSTKGKPPGLKLEGMCAGGSSFGQLDFLKYNLQINDGLVLTDGRISYAWQTVMFWRTFLALYLHMLCLLVL